MPKITRTQFRMMFQDGSYNSLCTGVYIDVPKGLTRQEALDYVTGIVAREVSRYAAAEALGIGSIPADSQDYWTEIVT